MFAHDLHDYSPTPVTNLRRNYDEHDAATLQLCWGDLARKARAAQMRRGLFYLAVFFIVGALFGAIAVSIAHSAPTRYYSRWPGDRAAHGTRTERGRNPAFYPLDVQRLLYPYTR